MRLINENDKFAPLFGEHISYFPIHLLVPEIHSGSNNDNYCVKLKSKKYLRLAGRSLTESSYDSDTQIKGNNTKLFSIVWVQARRVYANSV